MSEEQPSGTVAISVSVTAADAAVIAAKAKDMGLTIGQWVYAHLEGPIRVFPVAGNAAQKGIEMGVRMTESEHRAFRVKLVAEHAQACRIPLLRAQIADREFSGSFTSRTDLIEAACKRLAWIDSIIPIPDAWMPPVAVKRPWWQQRRL